MSLDAAVATAPLRDLLPLLRRGEIGAVELVENRLDALERDPVGAVAAIDHQGARAAAKAIDAARARGEPAPALAGAPLAHKDMFDRAGRVTGCGAAIARPPAAADAAVVERLNRAGALDLGALKMVEWALGLTGHNDVQAPPVNPRAPARIPGGSSSGSAAAVAAGLVPASLGSDTGGSIRIPASCCGVWGLKPTYGRVSRRGAMPLSHSLDTIGPIARTVEDLALVLGAIAGPDPHDPTSADQPVDPYLAACRPPRRPPVIGLPRAYFHDELDDEVRAALDEAAARLEGAGAELRETRTPDFIGDTNALTAMIIVAEGAQKHRLMLEALPEAYGAHTRARFEDGFAVAASVYLDAMSARGPALRDFLRQAMTGVDAVLAPTLATKSPDLVASDPKNSADFATMIEGIGRCLRPFNYLGLPAIAAPAGRDAGGAPIGCQLVGRPFEEATLLQIAWLLQEASPAVEPVP